MSATSDAHHADFFRYNNGRWVWDEEQQLRDRYREFDVPELQRIAAESVEANNCIDMTKLAEGSFNKVFRLVMDNGAVAIARIPNPNAGPQRYTTASEVATIDFVRTILGIPAPKVVAWNSSADNPVRAEYIVMEEATGKQIGQSWDEMKIQDRTAIIRELVLIQKTLLSASFTFYGNLYFASDSIKGSVPAEILGDACPETKNVVSKRFTIGPVATRQFWSKERSEMDIDRGPWKRAQDYVTSIASREIAWISRYAVPRPPDDLLVASAAQNSPKAHISLLKRFSKVAPYLLPEDPGLVSSNLWHGDLHLGNVFIDQNRITSIIDWQGTWAGPLFIQARTPQLVDHHGDMILRLPENYKELEDEEKARVKHQVASSIARYTYETHTAKVNPRLSKVFQFEHGRTKTEPISFAGDTWDNDILPFRETLINLERHWDELGVKGTCPFHFADEELQIQQRDGKGYNEAQDFWDSISWIVDRDGWTPNDMYDIAVSLFSEIGKLGLKEVTGEKQRAELKRWAEKSIR